MAKASNNEYPSVLFGDQTADPSNPGANAHRVYFKDDQFYWIDSAGAVHVMSKQPYAAVFHSTTQSITDATWTPLNMDSEDSDDEAWHDTVTNNTRVTVDRAGLYAITGTGSLNRGTQTQLSVMVRLMLDGTTELNRSGVHIAQAGVAYDNSYPSVAAYRRLSANSYIELSLFQQNGGAASLNTIANRSRLHVARISE